MPSDRRPGAEPPFQRGDRRRREQARQRARRRGQIRLAGVALIVVVLVIIVASTGGGHSSATASSRTASTHTTHHGTTHAGAGISDPLTTTAVRNFIASRQGDVSAAVEDLTTGREWILNGRARDQTASIVKADILETLLYQNQQNGDPVTDAESTTAQQMIEASDNDDASALWTQVGAASGIAAYNARAGLTDTTPGTDGFWGETLTTAPDQIRLLQQLLPAGSVLSAASKAYQLSLMESIDPGEQWGVTGGVPATGVTVALKNGWVTLTSNTDWEVNSIGWVRGDDHDYLIAVLTAHDPSEQYGINTINTISAAVYNHLGPPLKTGTQTIAQGVPDDD